MEISDLKSDAKLLIRCDTVKNLWGLSNEKLLQFICSVFFMLCYKIFWNSCLITYVSFENSKQYTVVWGVMKCPMPKCHCLSINYEIFILKWPFSASPKKISQWFSSMTLYAKWPHKPVNFNKIEHCLPLLAPTVQFRKVWFKTSLICVKNA